MEDTVAIGSKLIQLGFAGFCLIEMAIIVWLTRELIAVLKQNNQVLADLHQVMAGMISEMAEVKELAVDHKDKLLSRPCIARKQ